VKWGIFAVIALSVLGSGFYIKSRLRRLSQSIFGTNSLIDGYKNQKRQLSNTPKSVSSMTKIYLPLIQKDFPDFNFDEFKQKAENMLVSALLAISESNFDLVKNASDDLIEQIQLIIQQNMAQGKTEFYGDIVVFQTQITNYKKQMGTCVITLQSAVGHIHYIKEDNRLIEGTTEYPEQAKYNIDLIYIQDVSKLDSENSTALGVNCPNCGATISNLGHKFCEFCNTAIKEININVWAINKFTKL